MKNYCVVCNVEIEEGQITCSGKCAKDQEDAAQGFEPDQGDIYNY